MKYRVSLNRTEEGYSVWVPGLPGCWSQGKSEEDVIIFIDGDKGKIEIYTAPFEDEDSHLVSEELTELFAETEKDRKFISTVSAGKGASNSLWGCLNFSYYDRRRKVARLKQAGRGGIGSVFRDKGKGGI